MAWMLDLLHFFVIGCTLLLREAMDFITVGLEFYN
jgi:hypothetical protein